MGAKVFVNESLFWAEESPKPKKPIIFFELFCITLNSEETRLALDFNVVTSLQARIAKEIKMAIIPTVAGYMLPDLYSEWKKVLPNVQLTIAELKTDEILLALDNRKIDIGILAGPISNSKLRTIPLFQEEIKAFYDENTEMFSTGNSLTI